MTDDRTTSPTLTKAQRWALVDITAGYIRQSLADGDGRRYYVHRPNQPEYQFVRSVIGELFDLGLIAYGDRAGDSRLVVLSDAGQALMSGS